MSPRRTTRRMLSLEAVLLLTVLLMALASSSAEAQAPQRYGWWTASNPGNGTEPHEEGDDTLGPAGPPPGPGAVAHGDVPEGGFEVAGSTQQPSSVAALVYHFAADAQVGALTLEVAAEAANLPGSELRICALTTTAFERADGGPLQRAPEWDCNQEAAGEVTDDGGHIVFDAGQLAGTGELAVAVLPASTGARVVFERPGTSSLEVTDDGFALDPATPRQPAEPTPSPPADREMTPLPEPSSSFERAAAEPPRMADQTEAPRLVEEPAAAPPADEEPSSAQARPMDRTAVMPGTSSPQPPTGPVAGALGIVVLAALLAARTRRALEETVSVAQHESTAEQVRPCSSGPAFVNR